MLAVSQFVVIDGFVSVVWLAANMLLFFAALRVAERVFPDDSGANKVLNVSVSAISILTVVLLLLGAASILTVVSMLVGVSAVSLALLWRIKRREIGIKPEWRPRSTTSFWLLLTGLLCGHCLVNGLLKLPTDYDCLMYHLPMVDAWLQAGSLYAPDCSHWSNPGGSELLALWCCGPFSGDFLSPLNNLPVVFVWASATLQLCRLLGMTQRWPELTTISALSIYTLLHETDDASNDLMVVAFFMAANVYVLRLFVADEPRLLVMLGVCLGLLAGVKYFALGYAAVTWVTMLAGLIISTKTRLAVRAGILTAAMSVLVGGYWYLRNTVSTGLPMYPMGDATSLAYPNLWTTALVGNPHPDLWSLYFDAVWNVCGPIHWIAALSLPVTLLGLLSRINVNQTSDAENLRVRLISAALLLFGSAAVLWVTPYLVEDPPGSLNHLRWAYTPARYGLCFSTLSVVCLFTVLSNLVAKLSTRLRGAACVLLVCCLAAQIGMRIQSHRHEFSHLESLLAGLDIGVILLGLRWLLQSQVKRLWLTAANMVVVSVLVAGIGFVGAGWHSGLGPHFDRYFRTKVFTHLASADFDGVRILVLDYRSYPFYGSKRQHHVINPRGFATDQPLLESIHEHRASIVTALGQQGYAVDRYRGAFELLTSDKEKFSPLVESWPLIVVELPKD